MSMVIGIRIVMVMGIVMGIVMGMVMGMGMVMQWSNRQPKIFPKDIRQRYPPKISPKDIPQRYLAALLLCFRISWCYAMLRRRADDLGAGPTIHHAFERNACNVYARSLHLSTSCFQRACLRQFAFGLLTVAK